MNQSQDLRAGKLYLVHKDLYAWDGNRTITIQAGECLVILSTGDDDDRYRLTLLTKNGTVATTHMFCTDNRFWFKEAQT